MSALLSVEIDPGPIERTRADVAVVGLFDSDRPLRASAGRADWRLCGRLSALIAAGRLAGVRGDAVLVPTFGALRAPLLVALGLGARGAFDARGCEALAEDAVRRALELGATTIAFALPGGDAGNLALSRRAEAALAGAARALAEREVEVRLCVVTVPEEAARAAEVFGTSSPRGLPPSVVLRIPAARPRRLGSSPPGRQSPSPIAPQLVK